MNFKNITLGARLTITFLVLFFSIVVLGVFAYIQGESLESKVNQMYNHPLVVRRAIADINNGILVRRIGTRDLLLSKSKTDRERILLEVERADAEIERNFKLIYNSYLGNEFDIDQAYDAYKVWRERQVMNFALIANGEKDIVINNISQEGVSGKLRADLQAKLDIISNFAANKSDQIFAESKSLSEELLKYLIIILFVIVVFVILVLNNLINKIRKPINELKDVVLSYESGNLNVRSENVSTSEIGTLAGVFNHMLDFISEEHEINNKISRISDAMLIEDNSHNFFRTLLPVLAHETNSQIAAIFLLNDNKSEFIHYESIGLSASAENFKFSNKFYEGEFGTALVSKKMQFVQNIPIDTIFVFNTVSGKIIPREIVTVPILVGNEVIAVLSLASVRKYSELTVKLFHKINQVMTARIDGILAYREIRKSAAMLKSINSDLETQRIELNQQTIELQQQNTELETQKNQLKEANTLKTSFLSNMSHELRTPLNSVIALSGVLKRKLQNKIPTDEFSYISVIERNGKHLLSLINDILDISRIEAGREEVDVNEVNVCGVVENVIEMIKPQANERKVKLELIDNSEGIFVYTDHKKLVHILQNLIANAVKFTEKGSVKISTSKVDDNIYFKITDTGIGIAPSDINFIFDEFRQADSSNSRRFGGTGLGLSIARKYARLLGGDISVKSELEKGSEFTLTLPLNFDSSATISKVEKSFNNIIVQPNLIDKVNIEGKTILLIEDSEAAIIQIKEVLESQKYNVITTTSGNEALEVLNDTLPDGIILDLMMPKMDGFELLTMIRNNEKTKHVPVLILTAKHITKDDLLQLKSNHIHQLIQKGDVNQDMLLGEVYQMVIENKLIKTNQKIEPVNITGPNSTKKPKILIVEDNTDNMLTVKAILGDNYKIIEAVNGEESIEKAKSNKPDLILMDIALPLMNGVEAFKIIRSTMNLSHIPIIALTASAMTDERETILAHGFDDYLTKPIDEKIFFDTLNKVLYGK